MCWRRRCCRWVRRDSRSAAALIRSSGTQATLAASSARCRETRRPLRPVSPNKGECAERWLPTLICLCGSRSHVDRCRTHAHTLLSTVTDDVLHDHMPQTEARPHSGRHHDDRVRFDNDLAARVVAGIHRRRPQRRAARWPPTCPRSAATGRAPGRRTSAVRGSALTITYRSPSSKCRPDSHHARLRDHGARSGSPDVPYQRTSSRQYRLRAMAARDLRSAIIPLTKSNSSALDTEPVPVQPRRLVVLVVRVVVAALGVPRTRRRRRTSAPRWLSISRPEVLDLPRPQRQDLRRHARVALPAAVPAAVVVRAVRAAVAVGAVVPRCRRPSRTGKSRHAR